MNKSETKLTRMRMTSCNGSRMIDSGGAGVLKKYDRGFHGVDGILAFRKSVYCLSWPLNGRKTGDQPSETKQRNERDMIE